MRLKIYQARSKKHTSVVCAVGWTPANELFSVSDDRTIVKWGMDGEPENKPAVEQIDTYATDFRWYCSVRGGVLSADVFVISCCDGSFRIMSSSGRLEKSVPNAHTGAVTAVAWNFEGTALATAGEDGCVKQWSRSGNLRSKLATCDSAIYSVCWSPDNSSVLYCSGRFIMIKPLAVSAKQLKWRAHDGTVLKVDWNPVNNLIVSGGEDCKYKVWDSFGLLLFQSSPAEHVISSVSWCPNGNYFAVGSFNRIILCDKTGWSHSRSRTDSGSIQAIDWSADGTHLAGAGANGSVCFGQIVDRSVEWSHLEARLNEHNHVIVQDVGNEAGGVEDLEFGDGVIDMSLGYDHLIVATSKTCYIYHVTNLATPHIFELKGTVSLIMQAQKYFVLVDKLRGLLVYGYDGRSISNPRLAAGVHPQFLKRGNIAMSSDALAIIDRALPTQVHLIDIETGKPLCDPLRHDLEIVDISLSQSGLVSDRKLTFIDRNRDLHMHQCMATGTYKLATMVDSCIWHDRVDMVCAISDSKLLVWYYPNMVYVDRDLVTSTRSSRETTSLGKNVELVSFAESRVTVRRADGASQVLPISPYAQVLHRFAHSGEWSRAIRLCRVVRDSVLWSVLAGLSISAAELDTAEMSLAAIEEVDKLQYIQSIKAIPSQEGRTAELLLYRRQHDQAEQTLIQADLIYRAIQLNISIFRWARALDLAIRYKTHIDTVLGFRSKYLLSLERSENDERFLKLSQEVPCDWNSINIKIEQEIRKEEQRGTHYKTQTGFVPDLAAISIKYYSQQQQQQAAAAAAAAAAASSAPSFERKTDPTHEYGESSRHTFQAPPPQHMQSHPIIEQTNGTVIATNQHDDDLPF